MNPLLRLLSNIIAAVAIIIALGVAFDFVMVWWGLEPFTACTVIPATEILLGEVIAPSIAITGGVLWGLFRHRFAFNMMLVGALLWALPYAIIYVVAPHCG